MILTVEENWTHKIAVEALAELKHARSVGQRPRDANSLATWNMQNTESSAHSSFTGAGVLVSEMTVYNFKNK